VTAKGDVNPSKLQVAKTTGLKYLKRGCNVKKTVSAKIAMPGQV